MDYNDLYKKFCQATGLSPGPVEFRSMMDEQLSIMASSLPARQRGKAMNDPEQAEYALRLFLSWFHDGEVMHWTITADIARIVAAHNRPVAWCRILGIYAAQIRNELARTSD